MDSRSKYANLPFVAIGERDVFETEEIPEPEQSSVREPLWDASVDVIACGTLEAFQRFNDKNLNFIEKVFKLYLNISIIFFNINSIHILYQE
jgi:hypothetical protein